MKWSSKPIAGISPTLSASCKSPRYQNCAPECPSVLGCWRGCAIGLCRCPCSSSSVKLCALKAMPGWPFSFMKPSGSLPMSRPTCAKPPSKPSYKDPLRFRSPVLLKIRRLGPASGGTAAMMPSPQLPKPSGQAPANIPSPQSQQKLIATTTRDSILREIPDRSFLHDVRKAGRFFSPSPEISHLEASLTAT